MRIIAVNRFYAPDHSATAQLLTDLAEHLAVQGEEVVVVTSRQLYENAGAGLRTSEQRNGVAVRRVWTSRFGRHRLAGRALDYLSFHLAAFGVLLWETRPGDTVLAKTDPPLLSVLAWLAAWLRGAHLVNWCQDLFPEIADVLKLGWAAGPARATLRRLRNCSLRASDVNVVLCDRMANRLASEGVPAGRIAVIHNWVDGNLIRPVPAERNPLRSEWGLSGRRVIGYSGNLGRVHDLPAVQTFIKAMAATDPKLVFLFVGGGAGLVELEAWARSHRLSNNVLIRPYQPRERLAESLSVPDAHVVSLDPVCEGLIMPSKLYGVLAAGRPVMVVGDPHGAPAELVRELGCGLVWSKGREEEVLEWLRSGPATHRRIRATFEAHFCRERALACWEAALGLTGGKLQTRLALAADAA